MAGMTLKSILVLLVALAFAVSPFLNPEFGGFDPDRYPNPQIDPPVQPAGYAFAIWGVIYVWLLVSAGLGVVKYRDDPAWDATRLPLLVSLGVGMFWLPVALVSPVWATVMILVMLIFAVMACDKARTASPGWALALPLGLYAGWLTAATFVAFGLLGAGYGWVMAELGWAWTMVLLAAFCALSYQMTLRGVWTYGLAVAWGLIGIAVQNWGAQTGLAVAAGVAALLMLGLAASQLRR